MERREAEERVRTQELDAHVAKEKEQNVNIYFYFHNLYFYKKKMLIYFLFYSN